MQANSTPMAESIGKQQQTITELQAEIAKLKGSLSLSTLVTAITPPAELSRHK